MDISQASTYAHLSAKWVDKHRKRSERVLRKHKDTIDRVSNKAKKTLVGSGAGLLLLATPTQPLTFPDLPETEKEIFVERKSFFINDLRSVLPDQMRPLTSEEEGKIEVILKQYTGVSVKAELEGKKLNRTYGLIGAEQHLARYPGDTMASHFDSPEDSQKYYSSGMAPGLGAYGYFAYSKYEFTEEDKMREKYYIAVQTFLSEDFPTRFREYMEFYKYRKMLLVNPDNGKSMVVDIADSGPAAWTGKHLGGSPEVMKYLERVDGKQRGAVLYFFISPENETIPLGPLELVE